MNEEIYDKLDDLENSISSLESKIGNQDGGWLGMIIAVVIGFSVFSFFDEANFSIPEKKPTTESVKYFPKINRTAYYIIYNENFNGSAMYMPDENKVLFTIQNNSSNAIWLKHAKYRLWMKNPKRCYGLELDDENGVDTVTSILAFSADSKEILNPGYVFFARANLSSEFLTDGEIQGFSIVLDDGTIIRFGYCKLGWWDKLRWWAAEELVGKKTRDKLKERYGLK